MTPFIRIMLRYGAGALVAAGMMTPDNADFIATDPDVLIVAGAVITALTEFWYIAADRYGWRK